jgi:hypothetical protein
MLGDDAVLWLAHTWRSARFTHPLWSRGEALDRPGTRGGSRGRAMKLARRPAVAIWLDYAPPMRTLPGSLDGSQGDVHDESGRVASFAIDDQRIHVDDPVYVVFEDRHRAWEDRLVAGAGRGLRVSLVWWSGQRLDQVLVLEPDVLRSPHPRPAALHDRKLGIDFGDDARSSPLDAVLFGIDHPDL